MVEIEPSSSDLYYHMTAEEWEEKVRKMNLWPWKQEAIIDPEIELLHKDGLCFLPKGKVLLIDDSKIIGARCYVCQCGWWGNHHKVASLGLGTEVAFCQGCWEKMNHNEMEEQHTD